MAQRGSLPSRRPSIRLSSACVNLQAANSSHTAQWNCGPRNLSGSSAENVVAIAPFGHVNRRLLGSYTGLLRDMFSNPDSPSIITSRTSDAVAATIAPRVPGLAWVMAHSFTVRLFPHPRPASISHTRQSPGGATCDGLGFQSCRAVIAVGLVGRSRHPFCVRRDNAKSKSGKY